MDSRAQTIQALEAFVQSQRQFIAQTQHDIERLRNIKPQATENPEDFICHINEGLNVSIPRVGENISSVACHPQDLIWDVFAAKDPSSLKTLARDIRQRLDTRTRPLQHNPGKESSLQILVKKARHTILEPVFASLPPISPPSSEDELDPAEAKKQLEREKIRELKKRRIGSGLKLPSRLSIGGSDAVYIRRDQEDESGEVDVFDTGAIEPCVPSTSHSIDSMLVDTLADNLSSNTSTTEGGPTLLANRTRTKTKLHPALVTSSSKGKGKRKQREASPDTDTPQPASKKGSQNNTKAKPETYKQAWSVSEQHLLERLLEEIPDGEKNRWQKISRAMDGRRTPRQVASRVQKYFEKLKRYGVTDMS